MKPEDVPHTHAALAGLVSGQADRFRNKVTSYDIEASGFGFMLAARRGHDDQHKTEQPDHPTSSGDSITSSTRTGLSVHTKDG